MLKCKNIGTLVKWNSKIICLYEILRARRKSLQAHYEHAYERARDFVCPLNPNENHSSRNFP